jgi:hypothetical protein
MTYVMMGDFQKKESKEKLKDSWENGAERK